jgi:hypothetical protein
LQSVPIHSTNVVKLCTKVCRRVHTSTLLYLIGSESSYDLGYIKIWLTGFGCIELRFFNCRTEAATASRQSAYRWGWVCQLYAPAELYPPARYLALISVRRWVNPKAIMRLERLYKLKQSKINNLIGNRASNLPAFSIVPEPTTSAFQISRHKILCVSVILIFNILKIFMCMSNISGLINFVLIYIYIYMHN